MKVKTEVWVIFAYGGWDLSFSKKFVFDFVPFAGMSLDDKDVTVDFETNDYCRTIISYDVRKKLFVVDVRNVWKNPVSDDTIDYEISTFKDAGWKRRDTTDVIALKELMKRKL